MNRYSRFALVLSIISATGFGAIYERVNGPDTAPAVINIDGAIAIFDNTALPGVDIGIAGRIASAPLYLGGDLSLLFHAADPSFVIMPILGTLYYQFEPYGAVHPLLGVLAGPVISTGGGFSTVRMGVLMRPGMNIEIGRTAALNIEPRFGVLGDAFVFAPQVGATFAM